MTDVAREPTEIVVVIGDVHVHHIAARDHLGATAMLTLTQPVVITESVRGRIGILEGTGEEVETEIGTEIGVLHGATPAEMKMIDRREEIETCLMTDVVAGGVAIEVIATDLGEVLDEIARRAQVLRLNKRNQHLT